MAEILLARSRMCRSNVRRFFVAAASLVLLTTAAPARAATISLGYLSFDQFLAPFPGDPTSVGTNAFNIFNSSGVFAAPPDPTALLNPADPVSLLNASLLLTADDGSTTDVAIGTIAPGLLDDGAGNPLFGLQFPDTTHFTSAVFTGTLSTLTFLLTDGTSFTADSAALLFTLAAAPGAFLVPNPLAETLTFVSFDITGAPSTSVPEPGTLVLLASGLGAAFVMRARRKRI